MKYQNRMPAVVFLCFLQTYCTTISYSQDHRAFSCISDPSYHGLWQGEFPLVKGQKKSAKLEIFFPSAGCFIRLIVPSGKTHVLYPKVWREGSDIILLQKALPADPIKYPFFNWMKIRLRKIESDKRVRLRHEYVKNTMCDLKSGRVVKISYPKRLLWLVKTWKTPLPT